MNKKNPKNKLEYNFLSLSGTSNVRRASKLHPVHGADKDRCSAARHGTAAAANRRSENGQVHGGAFQGALTAAKVDDTLQRSRVTRSTTCLLGGVDLLEATAKETGLLATEQMSKHLIDVLDILLGQIGKMHGFASACAAFVRVYHNGFSAISTYPKKRPQEEMCALQNATNHRTSFERLLAFLSS